MSSKKIKFNPIKEHSDLCSTVNAKCAGHCVDCEGTFEAGQSYPNDKIRRALEMLKHGSYGDGPFDYRIINAIEILEER